MAATALAAAVLATVSPQTHPCRAPLPRGPLVPAQVVLWTSCGSYRLAPDGRVSRLPRHWLALHGSGTGRLYGAGLEIRRTHAGRFLLLLHGRVVWRSSGLYPRDGGEVAFGPHSFAFASYRRGVFLTDLRGRERLVARGRGLVPYSFTSGADLIVAGGRTIRLVSSTGMTVRRFHFRLRNSFSFDERTDTLFFVTPAGHLAAARGAQVELGRQLPRLDGMLSVAGPTRLVFSSAHAITVVRRDGSLVAEARWQARRLSSDSGVSVSPDGNAFAFRLSDAHPGSLAGTATVYLLTTGRRRAQAIYRRRLGPSGCAVGATLTWHNQFLLYRSSDGRLAIIDTQARTSSDLTAFARALPRRSSAERALADWRAAFRP